MDGVTGAEADLRDRFSGRLDASALAPCAFARAAIDMLVLSVWAACSAIPIGHSSQSSALLIESARRSPAVAPFTMVITGIDGSFLNARC